MSEIMLALLGKKTAVVGPSYALFGGAMLPSGTGGYPTATTDKYDYSNAGVANGSALAIGRNYVAAAGNATMGVWAGGVGDAAATRGVVDVYTYAGDLRTAGTSTGTDYEQGATSNANFGYYGGGAVSATIMRKYSFSGNAWTAGTALPSGGKGYPSAAGNGTIGLFTGVGGCTRYTYAGDTVAAGVGLTQFRSRGAAVAKSDAAIFCAGWGDGGAGMLTSSDRINIAANTISAGPTFTPTRQRFCGATNGTMAVVAGGMDTASSAVRFSNEYLWAPNTNAAGTILTTSRAAHGACSSTPAHLS